MSYCIAETAVRVLLYVLTPLPLSRRIALLRLRFESFRIALHPCLCHVVITSSWECSSSPPGRFALAFMLLYVHGARWPIRDGDRVGRGRESDRLDRGNRPKKTGETVDRRQNEVLRRCPFAIAQRLVHCAIAVSTAVLDRVTKTMSVALLLTNNLDNSKQKTSNLLSPAPPPYS